jgi:hypothetical protein
MAVHEIDVASACTRAFGADRLKIHLGGPDGGVVLNVTSEAAHHLLALLRDELRAVPVARLLDNAVVATRMQQTL